jgi:membrane protein required for colicin V production
MTHIFTWADYVILAIVGISVLISIIRGFIREILSLAVWVAAFVVAFKFCKQLASIFAPYADNVSLRITISFAILFIIVLILGGLVTYLISILISKTHLSFIDRTLGMIFGFVRGILVVAVLLLLLSVHSYTHESWWSDSYFIPHFKSLVTWLNEFFPKTVNHIKDNIITPEVTS